MEKSSKQIMAQGRYLTLVNDSGWEYVVRSGARGVVILIPVTSDGEAILVEQYRRPLEQVVIEWPAGLVGDLEDPNESLEVAAHRELLEETGYHAGRLTRMWRGPTSPGLCSEIVEAFYATDLDLQGPGGGDASENIIVHRIALERIHVWLSEKMAEGILVDPKVFSGLYWLSMYRSDCCFGGR